VKVALNFRKGFPALLEGFQALGCEVVENAWSSAALQGVDACIIELYDGVRQPWTMWRLKNALRRGNVPLIALDRDAPWHKGVRSRKLWLFDRLGLLDIYATHALQNSRPFAPNVIYLPNAAWTGRYGLGEVTLEDMRQPGWYRHDVSFLGNLDAARYPEHRKRADFLSQLGLRLKMVGVNAYFRDSADMTPEQQVEIIQRSRINLNCGAACDNGPERSWGLAERCYGIPACGGFLLSDERRHARDDFALDAEWVFFNDLDDCVAKVCHYLKHPDQARAIAEAAHCRVMRDHTYQQRAERLIAEIRDWRARAP
jgi:spore maturation protein CgeB